MIYLFTYEEIKNRDVERRTRSLSRYEQRRALRTKHPSPMAHEPAEAEVIELVFGAQCEHGIGA